MTQVIQLSTEKDINSLAQLYSTDSLLQQRLKNDFMSGYFKCFLNITKDGDILGYLIFYNTYSTWQHRTYFVSNVWLSSILNEEEKFNRLKELFEKLVSYSKENQINRINMNFNLGDEEICNWVQKLGVVDLTIKEDWQIMEMQSAEIKEIISYNIDLKPGFTIVKATKIENFSKPVRDLIYELSVFEKMENQCEITEEWLIRDFKSIERNIFDEKTFVKDRFYDLSVIVKDDIVIGFAIYYLKYELNRGLGFFLEDLFVIKEYRGCGLGTSLWQFVINDVVKKHQIAYMQWTVLGWNTEAIDFYTKYKSKNLTELYGTHFFRMLRETIYA